MEAGMMKSSIHSVSRALTAVHKALLDETIREFEQRERRSISPQTAWHAAMHDPFFSWLRPVSLLIAEIDELLSQAEEIGPGLAHGVRIEVESILHGMTSGASFARRYREMLQRDPDLVARHGELKLALARLPESGRGEEILTREQWPLPGRDQERGSVH